jgi:D-alanyl-D-alanine carboxypeptidase
MTWRRAMHAMMALTLLAALAMTFATQAQAANPKYAAIVVDMESGEVLHAANADATRYPASLTKMMTLYLVFEALESGGLNWRQLMPVSSHAASMQPSKLYLKAGSTIAVEDAVKVLVVRSANDVAVVIAEALGGSETNFGRMMTAKARELGMPSTRFRNASGLPDSGQVTTARDMATLSIRLMRDFPQHYHLFSTKSFTYKGKTHKSHNRLVGSYPGADGLKTGYIRASGFNVATSAVRDGRRLLSVVMGGYTSQSRDAHMADLLDRGFVRASLYKSGDWLANADFSGGKLHVPTAMPAPSPVPAASSMMASAEQAPVERVIARETAERPVFEQGSAEDPIRQLISLSPTFGSDEVADGWGGSWGVQVGAFSSADSARLLASRAADSLAGMSGARIAVAQADAGEAVYRARLVNLKENQAYDACRSLVREGMDCMVVNAGL